MTLPSHDAPRAGGGPGHAGGSPAPGTGPSADLAAAPGTGPSADVAAAPGTGPSADLAAAPLPQGAVPQAPLPQTRVRQAPHRASGAPQGVTPERGALILGLGVAGVLCLAGIPGLVAWFLGGRDLRAMDSGTMDDSGRGATRAGRIIGLVGFLLNAVALVITVIA